MKRTIILTVAGAAAITLSGCSGSSGSDPFAQLQTCGRATQGTSAADVSRTIHCFAQALGRQDGDTVCDLLTTTARQQTLDQGATTGRDVRTCADATRRALVLAGARARDTFAHLDAHLSVGAVSVSGGRAHARVSVAGLAGVPDASDTVTLYAQNGGWKLSDDAFHIDV